MVEADPFVVNLTVTVTGLLLCIFVGHWSARVKYLNEANLAVIFGLGIGATVIMARRARDEPVGPHMLEFDEKIFFQYILPPIIFNAGFSVKKKQFFSNFYTIILYGVVGTVISFIIISIGSITAFNVLGVRNVHLIDCLALGAIFSSTDTVLTLQIISQDKSPLLYSLVFGEGVLNDATSVVLLHTIQKFAGERHDLNLATTNMIVMRFIYMFTFSLLLGGAIGLLSAVTVRHVNFSHGSAEGSVQEIAVILLQAYLAYLVSELLGLSGIFAVFFCGIVMSHYTWYNVNARSRTTTKQGFGTLSFIAETFAFLYVGVDVLDPRKWERTTPGLAMGMFWSLLLLVMFARAIAVFPLSALSNISQKPSKRIGFREQMVVWWAGSMRGAVSIALAYSQFSVASREADKDDDPYATLIATTLAVVLFTVVVFGGMTKQILQFLIPEAEEEHGAGGGEAGADGSGKWPETSQALVGGEESRSKAQDGFVHRAWRWLDDTYMQPVFGGQHAAPVGHSSSHGHGQATLPRPYSEASLTESRH
eukprot:jgi/Mesvir1/18982/Mv18945-RA.1